MKKTLLIVLLAFAMFSFNACESKNDTPTTDSTKSMKCSEGKCAEGKCGESKKETAKKCASDGKCGEGKCGAK